ncbi:MAG: hypothetical protein AAGH65_07680 [Pseudomonadota bacterium]
MKDDDVFRPGVTDDQVRRAEEMLGSLGMDLFVEKRGASQHFRAGQLADTSTPNQRIEVMVSDPFGEPKQRALLSHEEVPTMQFAKLNFEQAARTVTLLGRVQSSRRGRRSGDQDHDEPVFISIFVLQNE